jgi:hypothetical protein
MKEGPLVPKTHGPGIVFLTIIVKEWVHHMKHISC